MKVVFFWFLTYALLFGASIDQSWFDSNATVLKEKYELQSKNISQLLQNKSLSVEENEQLDYQQLLLKKLLEIVNSNQNEKTVAISDIKSMSDFIKGMQDYSAIEESYTDKTSALKVIQNKIQILKTQMSDDTKNEISSLNAQLLYALYTLQSKNIENNLKMIRSVLDNNKKVFLDALRGVDLKLSSDIEIQIEKSKKLFEKYVVDERVLLVSYDKAQISQNEKLIKKLESNIEKIKTLKLAESNNLVWFKVEKLLPLLQSKSSDYFSTFKELQTFVQSSHVKNTFLIELFKYLSREHMGITQTTLADTKSSILDMVKYFWNEINNPFIPLGKGISVLNITQFIMIFVLGFSTASFYRKKITSSIGYFQNSSASTRTMLSNLGYYFLVFITFSIGLNSVGIDLSSLTILVGALSVGIGFGLQNIVSNFISGIILIFEKTIQVGNIIEIEAGIRGKVTQINMRSSVITAFDNVEYIIPNSTFIQTNIVNLTLSDDIRRLNIPFGVAYGSDIEKVNTIILDALKQSSLVYIKNNKDQIPKIWMNAMGASSLDMTLLVWIHSNGIDGMDSSSISDFLIFIYKVLQENNIEIPFPQLDLHIKSNIASNEITKLDKE